MTYGWYLSGFLSSVVASTAGVGVAKVYVQADTVVIENGLVRICFDLKKAHWSGVDARDGTIVFKDAGFQLEPGQRRWKTPAPACHYEEKPFQDALGSGRALTIYYAVRSKYEPNRALVIRVYDAKPFVALGFGVINQRSWPARIREVRLLDNGELFAGQQIKSPKVLRGGAGAERNFVEDTWEIDAINSAMLTYKSNGTRRTLVAGGLRYKEFVRRVEFRQGVRQDNYPEAAATLRYSGKDDVLEKGRRQMTLSLWDPQGKRVGPGQTYWSEDTIYLDFITRDPFVNLEQYGLALRAANDAQPNVYDFPTLCGWMVSNRRLGEGKPINNSPGLVNEVKIAGEKGLFKYTPLAVRLEPDAYCYRKEGDTEQGWWDDEHFARFGHLRPPYERFEKFGRAVQQHGGILFTYFQCSLPSNDFAVQHPDWMLNNDISLLYVHHRHHRPLVRYDYTDPGFQAHMLKVWRRLRAAGVRGIKFDYPETAWALYGGFQDKSYTTASAYRKLFELCREGLGKDAFIHERIIGGGTHENVPRTDINVGVVDLQRVWGDSSHFEPEMASRMGLRWYKNRVAISYYPDGKSMYEPRKDGEKRRPLSATKRRTMLTLIGLLSGRIELGTSIGSMTPEMLHDLTRLYPMIREPRSPRPVDMLMGKRHPEVYVYPASERWIQVILMNNDRRRKTIHVPFSGDQADTGSLGLDAEKAYYVYEFWNQKWIGRFQGTDMLAVEQRPREALVYSVREVLDRPQVLSTNRHVMQGLMDLHDVRWTGSALTGAADVVGGEEFRIVVAENGRTPHAIHADSARASFALTDRENGLVEIALSAEDNTRVTWRLEF